MRVTALAPAALALACAREPAPPPAETNRYEVGAFGYALSFHPSFAPAGAHDPGAGEPDRVRVCGEEFESVSLPRLRVWAADPSDLPAFVRLGSECLADADALLGDELLDLTLVVVGELPGPEEGDLEDFARSPRTIVIAMPAERLVHHWLIDAVEAGLASLGRSPAQRAEELPSFAASPGLRELVRTQVEGIVRHELGHLALYAAYAARSGQGFEGAGSYGSPLDDWLDETAAASFEPSAFGERVSHRCVVHEEAPPLEVFFAARHLHSAGRESGADAPARGGQAWFQGQVSLTLTNLSSEAGVTSAKAGSVAGEYVAVPGDLFYPQSRLFADYLRERGGPHALASLLDDALGGLTIERSLKEGRASGCLPPTTTELQQDWERWLASE